MDLGVGLEDFRALNVGLLSGFVTAQQQHDQIFRLPNEVDSIPRATMDSRFEQAASQGLAVAEIFACHSLRGYDHASLGGDIAQSFQAALKRFGLEYFQIAP